ncbi:MAG: hypothetical protein PHT75_00700 [Bacilli bacterium]|nr:hypothetical protein [Bacilli bacterium]MDD3304634.1 hypothetical protein [Bacilli bacterium]MDD4053547.1 hypothetical protein [Bacilli bacterium]MDD4411486.1 hypothetical protein [Bacilli bacterium]
MIDVMTEVDNTVDIIDKSDIVERLRELKLIMDSDEEIIKLSINFNAAKEKYNKDNKITKDLIDTKKNYYNNSIVSEYRMLYTKLNNSFLKFNKDLNGLLNNGKDACNK